MKYEVDSLVGIELSKEDSVYQFLQSEGRVFQKPSYLDAICSDWKAVVVSVEGNILAVQPLVLTKKVGVRSSFIPQYVHIYGPVFTSKGKPDYAAVIKALLDHTRRLPLLEWKLPISNQDLLPYLSSGCTVQATQSHLIAKGSEAKTSLLHASKRRYLKRLQQKLEQGELQVLTGPACHDDLIALQMKTAKKRGFQTNLVLLERIVKSLGKEYAYSLVVYTASGEPLSGAFCPFDQHYAYHIINASEIHTDQLLNKSNILSSFLAVSKALEKGLGFDFEGSNIPGVAQFYRMMGGEPTVFFRVQKANDWKGKLMFSSFYWK